MFLVHLDSSYSDPDICELCSIDDKFSHSDIIDRSGETSTVCCLHLEFGSLRQF